MSILEEIIQRNRPSLEERKQRIPFEEMTRLAENASPRPSFTEAFLGEGIHVIAELKSASPSKGLIRPNLQVAELAKSLEEAGAAALSVLTEPFYFKGSLQNLENASKSCGLPLLRKDFIFDTYQIAEAKAYGASAILLIAAMLSEDEFQRLLEYAHSLGLDVLGEAHTEEELKKVQMADLVGVNARNLHDFSTSLEHSASLIRIADFGKPIIAESAVSTPDDMRFLKSAGANGFLIGESLMRASAPGIKLKELLACF